MAGIADMLVQGAVTSSQQSADLAGASAKGAQLGTQLAQTIEQAQTNRAQIEQRKQELQMQKAVAVTDTLKIAAQSKDPKLKRFLLQNVLPGKIKALGMEEFFGPQTLQMAQESEEVQKKILGLQLDLDEKIRSNQMTGAQAYQYAQSILQDPEQLAQLDTDRLYEAQAFANSEEGKSARAALQGQIAMGKQVQAQQAAPQVEANKKIQDTHTNFIVNGGQAGAEKNLSNMEEVLAALQSGKLKTGGLGTMAAYRTGTLSALNPDLQAAMDKIQGAVNLRAGLADPNPTERQISQILSRSFNPELPNKQNIDKLKTAIREYKTDLANKKKEWRRLGLPGVEDAPQSGDWLSSKKDAFSKLPPDEQDKFISGAAAKLGISPDQVREGLK